MFGESDAIVVSTEASAVLARAATAVVSAAVDFKDKNWGSKWFVGSFLSVVRTHKTQFKHHRKTLRNLNLQQTGLAARESRSHKHALNMNLRKIYTEARAFTETMENLIEEIAEHYRLKPSELRELTKAVEDMNSTIKEMDNTLQEGLDSTGCTLRAENLLEIKNATFSKRKLTAKLTGKGGPAPLRTGGIDEEAKKALTKTNKKLHTRYVKIDEEMENLSNLKRDIEFHIDRSKQNKAEMERLSVQENHEAALKQLKEEEERNLREVEQKWLTRTEELASQVRQLEEDYKLQDQSLLTEEVTKQLEDWKQENESLRQRLRMGERRLQEEVSAMYEEAEATRMKTEKTQQVINQRLAEKEETERRLQEEIATMREEAEAARKKREQERLAEKEQNEGRLQEEVATMRKEAEAAKKKREQERLAEKEQSERKLQEQLDLFGKQTEAAQKKTEQVIKEFQELVAEKDKERSQRQTGKLNKAINEISFKGMVGVTTLGISLILLMLHFQGVTGITAAGFGLVLLLILRGEEQNA